MCRLSSGTAIISLLGDTANLTRKKKSDATFCESDAGAAPWACRLDLGSGWIRCGPPPTPLARVSSHGTNLLAPVLRRTTAMADRIERMSQI